MKACILAWLGDQTHMTPTSQESDSIQSLFKKQYELVESGKWSNSRVTFQSIYIDLFVYLFKYILCEDIKKLSSHMYIIILCL